MSVQTSKQTNNPDLKTVSRAALVFPKLNSELTLIKTFQSFLLLTYPILG